MPAREFGPLLLSGGFRWLIRDSLVGWWRALVQSAACTMPSTFCYSLYITRESLLLRVYPIWLSFSNFFSRLSRVVFSPSRAFCVCPEISQVRDRTAFTNSTIFRKSCCSHQFQHHYSHQPTAPFVDVRQGHPRSC